MKKFKSLKLGLAALLLAITAFWVPTAAFAQSTYPMGFTFGSTLVGQAAATQVSTFTNTTGVTLTMTVAATPSGTNGADWAVVTSPATNCGTTLATGATCTLTFTFTPLAAGVRSAFENISWTGAGGSPITIQLSGYGQLGGNSTIEQPVGVYQGTTTTADTVGTFVALASPVAIPAGAANYLGKKIRVHGSGVYTTGAASIMSMQLSFCTVSGCATGTNMVPAGWLVTGTNQANVLANAPFTIDGTFTVATTGASATGMAKSQACFDLGTAVITALSCFPDPGVALSAAVDLTVTEYVTVSIKYTTANAGNIATLEELSVEFLN